MAVSKAMAEAASRFLELLDDGQRQRAVSGNAERDADHIHTVWRDAVGDFGHDLLAHRCAASHQVPAVRVSPCIAPAQA